MNLAELVTVIVVLGALALLMLGLGRLGARFGWPAELKRKSVHMGMGLVVLPFPWLFQSPAPVVVLATMACAFLMASRRIPVLKTHFAGTIETDRASSGELWFPVGVATVFCLSFGRPLLFVVPVLVLSFADAAAALVGQRHGRRRYRTFDGQKSLEGSLVFFVTAVGCVLTPMVLLSDASAMQIVLIAITLGMLASLLESIAWRGLDNLFIPLGSFALLDKYLELEPQMLALRLVLTLTLVAFTLRLRRSSTLDESALMGAALFGYCAVTLGGWQWLLAPLGVFLALTSLWPRYQTDPRHTVHNTLVVTAVGLFWLVAYTQTGWVWAMLPFAASFAAHLGIYAMYQSQHAKCMAEPTWPTPCNVLLGAGVGALPTLVAFLLSAPNLGSQLVTFSIASFALTLVATAVAVYSYGWVYTLTLDPQRDSTTHRLTCAGLAGGTSLVCAWPFFLL